MTTAPAAVLLRSDIPVEETWDLTDYYPSDAAWQQAAEAIGPLVGTAAAFRGRLTESVENLKSGLDAVMTAQEALSRLFTYAALRSDEDITNTETRAMRERATRIATDAGAKLAFIEPEILTAPEEQLSALIAAPELEGYRHLLEDLARKRAHTRSIEVEELLAQSADISRAPREIFDALDDADLEYGTFKD
jgi:oligoendopeptidase F